MAVGLGGAVFIFLSRCFIAYLQVVLSSMVGLWLGFLAL
jgi:hypothetical protein